MKKALLLTVLSFIILCFPIIYLACTSNDIKASLGKEFTLPVGKTAAINGEQLSVEFVEVTADSRCPTGAECIVAGEARCDIVFTYKSQEYKVTLVVGTSAENSVVFTDYDVNYNLEPYPQVGKDIARKDYSLILMITSK